MFTSKTISRASTNWSKNLHAFQEQVLLFLSEEIKLWPSLYSDFSLGVCLTQFFPDLPPTSAKKFLQHVDSDKILILWLNWIWVIEVIALTWMQL